MKTRNSKYMSYSNVKPHTHSMKYGATHCTLCATIQHHIMDNTSVIWHPMEHGMMFLFNFVWLCIIFGRSIRAQYNYGVLSHTMLFAQVLMLSLILFSYFCSHHVHHTAMFCKSSHSLSNISRSLSVTNTGLLKHFVCNITIL